VEGSLLQRAQQDGFPVASLDIGEREIHVEERAVARLSNHIIRHER
jgi:hypothetical protein